MLAVQRDHVADAASAELAARHNVRLHTHLAETADEDRFCQETHGCRPLDYLEQCGWLHDNVWLAHGVHFDAGEMARLARAGVSRHALPVQQPDPRLRSIARSAIWNKPACASGWALTAPPPTTHPI